MARGTSEIDHLLELLEPAGALTARRMFGGWGIYADGRMFAIVVDGELLLKVDAATRARFEGEGCQPFVYHARGREIPMSYWTLPAEAMDSAEAMRPWARMALEAAARKAEATPARGRKPKPGRI